MSTTVPGDVSASLDEAQSVASLREAQSVASLREAQSAAVRLLSSREHARVELARKLVGKGHSRDVVDAALERLEELELLSDERFAESFVRSRVDRGHGPLRIRADLRSRGVDESIIDTVLMATDDYWRDHAELARQKRFGPVPPDGRDTWTRQARFLAQRGFPSDVIYRVLGDLGT